MWYLLTQWNQRWKDFFFDQIISLGFDSYKSCQEWMGFLPIPVSRHFPETTWQLGLRFGVTRPTTHPTSHFPTRRTRNIANSIKHSFWNYNLARSNGSWLSIPPWCDISLFIFIVSSTSDVWFAVSTRVSTCAIRLQSRENFKILWLR